MKAAKKVIKQNILRFYKSSPMVSIRHKLFKKKIIILLYHEIPPDLFSEHLSFLKKKYNIISLKTFADCLNGSNDKVLPENSLVITFDDGWKSNYQLLPVIKEHGLPITIFLLAGLINTNRKVWNYTLERLGNERDLNTRLKDTPNDEKNKILRDKNGYFPEKEYADRDFLNIEELTEMKNHVDFQSHGMFHPVYPMCSDDEINEELSESKKALQSIFGAEIYGIAYPYGRHTQRDVDFVKKHGYKISRTASNSGFNELGSDPYRLRAIGVKNSLSIGQLDDLICRVELKDLLGK